MNLIYNKAKHYINMVAKGDVTSFIWKSEGGMSKSYTVHETLNEIGVNWKYISGYLTPLHLYTVLYSCRNKDVIVFDDVENLLADKNTTAILKSALWSTTKDREVAYRSSTDKLKCPSSFILKAGIILCVNRIPKKNNADMKALISRCIYYDMHIPMEIVKELILNTAPNIEIGDLKDRTLIAEYLCDKITVATENVNLRTLVKALQIYNYNKDESVWKPLVDELIIINEELEYAYELMNNKEMKAKAKASEFGKKFGKSTRSYYNAVKRLRQKLLKNGDR